MASKDGYEKLGKLVEAGLTVAKIAQTKAEESLRDIVHISEVQRNQVRELIEDAARRSKESRESLLKSLRKEFEKQLESASLISREELVKLSERLNSVSRELAKVSVLREEVDRLTEMINALMRLISKSDVQGNPSNSAPNAPIETNHESFEKAPDRSPDSGSTSSKSNVRSTKVSSKPGSKAADSTSRSKPRTRTRQGTGDSSEGRSS